MRGDPAMSAQGGVADLWTTREVDSRASNVPESTGTEGCHARISLPANVSTVEGCRRVVQDLLVHVVRVLCRNVSGPATRKNEHTHHCRTAADQTTSCTEAH